MFIKNVRLAKDWKVIEGANGKFAVNTIWWKNWKKESIFFDVILFNEKRVETIIKYTKKGSKIGIVGELSTNTFDAKCKHCKEINTVTSSTIVIKDFEFLDTRDKDYNDVSEMDASGRIQKKEQAKPTTDVEDMFTSTNMDTTPVKDDKAPF